jgi:hypothetical protein
MYGDEGGIPFERLDLGDGNDLGVCVNPDGSLTFWILVPGGEIDQGCYGTATHERTGRLPLAWQRKVDAIGMCGQPTGHGPCPNQPVQDGLCAQHTPTPLDGRCGALTWQFGACRMKLKADGVCRFHGDRAEAAAIRRCGVVDDGVPCGVRVDREQCRHHARQSESL